MKILLLLKKNFLSTFSPKKFLNLKPIKKVLIILLAIYTVFSVEFSLYMYFNIFADKLQENNLLSMMPLFLFLFSAFSTFTLSINIAKSNMFSSSDNELLFSMPVKTSSILISRLINLVIWNLFISLFITIPALVVYVSRVPVDLMFYLNIAVIYLFFITIPTILASIFGYLIAYIVSKTNSKNILEILTSLFFIGIIMYVMNNAGNIISYMVANIKNIEAIIKYMFYPIYLISDILVANNMMSLIKYIGINILIIVVFVYLLNINYKKIIFKLQENRTKSTFVLKELKSNSIKKSLFFKELKRYISSPIYFMNTALLMILLLFFSISSIFMDRDNILQIIGLSVDVPIFQIILAAIAFCILISNTTGASISMEGENFWIIKSLPIDYKEYLYSKIYMNILVTLPISIISILIFTFTLNLSFVECMVLIIISGLLSLFSAYLGVLVNLRFPKMDAVNDTVIVKRSLSVMLSGVVPMFILYIIVGIYILTKIDIKVLIFIVSILLSISILVSIRLLEKYGIKRLHEIQ